MPAPAHLRSCSRETPMTSCNGQSYACPWPGLAGFLVCALACRAASAPAADLPLAPSTLPLSLPSILTSTRRAPPLLQLAWYCGLRPAQSDRPGRPAWPAKASSTSTLAHGFGVCAVPGFDSAGVLFRRTQRLPRRLAVAVGRFGWREREDGSFRAQQARTGFVRTS